MKNVAIMGGTFNPIHIAHLIVAECVYETGKFDEVCFMPTGNPPHKDNEQIVSNGNRYNMCSLAIEGQHGFTLSDYELKREGKIYSVDTFTQLAKSDSNRKYWLIIGTDSLLELENWYNAEKLLTIGAFVVVHRSGFSQSKGKEYMAYLNSKYHTPFIEVNMPQIELSSSVIRQRILDNLSISNYVPVAVETYIKNNRLYIGDRVKPLDIILKEQILIINKLKNKLIEKRYQHTIRVATTAYSLAQKHNCDVEETVIAGLLHDCVKHFSDKKLLKYCTKYNIKQSEAEEDNADLLHSKVGAYVARDKYNIDNPDIFNAIKYHTTGRPSMSILEKIIFISDYIEPGRKPLNRIDLIREIAEHDLNKAMMYILEDTLKFLETKNKKIDLLTNKTYLYYKQLRKE